MSVATERKGQAAAPGLALAPLEELLPTLSPGTPSQETKADPDAERSRLEQAIRAAIGGLNALVAQADSEAGEILAFQVAMLEDPNLAEPAWQAIATGSPAGSAWTLATAPLIADFEGSGDALFAARASDLCDLRDRVLAELNGTPAGPLKQQPGATVLLADDLSPSQFLSWTWHPGSAIALRRGSAASHLALLARSRGIPMVVGLGPLDAAGHQLALVDGDSGRVVLSPDPVEQARMAHAPKGPASLSAGDPYVMGPARTGDGVAINLQLNINGVEDLAGLNPGCCDGIGLVRSEFLFSQGLPREDQQFQAYRRILEWADGRSVTIRTLDAGGDKAIPGLSLPEEANPFLGCRGLRFSLAHPALFEVQLRALARAAWQGLWPAERRWNHAALTAWEVALSAGLDPLEGAETLTEQNREAEMVYLGLRTIDGLELREGEEAHVATWRRQGWIESVHETAGVRIRCTASGWLRLDALAADLTALRSRS
jgi:phosphotransferase system enzyme I (PtsI)